MQAIAYNSFFKPKLKIQLLKSKNRIFKIKEHKNFRVKSLLLYNSHYATTIILTT